MSLALISLSPDLARLRDAGYNVEVNGAYLLVHDVPYVGTDKKVRRATLASTLHLAGDRTTAPDTHVALFTGDHPCHADGTPIAGIKHSDVNETLRQGLVARFSFSNKPPNGYPDYYEKMVQYVRIISDPAAALEPTATAQTRPASATADEEIVFQYLDTASSRAGINCVATKLRGHKVAIVGVGGTGSYILDVVAKTAVAEIHLFDDDRLYTHNAFRAPGAPSIEELRSCPTKVQYFAGIYSRIHKHVVPHVTKITDANLEQLDPFNSVFLCLDNGAAKRAIIARLHERNVPFIDVGMQVDLVDEQLIATVRVTASTTAKRDHVARRISCGEVAPDDDYTRNIQIADLNAFNGVLAVMKWKKICGLYQDLTNEHNDTYQLNVNELSNDEIAS